MSRKKYYLSHESGRFKKRYILQEYIKRIEKEIKTIFLNFLFLIKKNDLTLKYNYFKELEKSSK